MFPDIDSELLAKNLRRRTRRTAVTTWAQLTPEQRAARDIEHTAKVEAQREADLQRVAEQQAEPDGGDDPTAAAYSLNEVGGGLQEQTEGLGGDADGQPGGNDGDADKNEGGDDTGNQVGNAPEIPGDKEAKPGAGEPKPGKASAKGPKSKPGEPGFVDGDEWK